MSQSLNAQASKILQGKNIAMVATISEDGSPHLTPVWIDSDGKNVLVNTVVGRKKERNVGRDPRIAIAVFDSNNPYSWVSINGRVAKKSLVRKPTNTSTRCLTSTQGTGNTRTAAPAKNA